MGDMSAALEYEEQAKQFLEKAWEYLAVGDLHQAGALHHTWPRLWPRRMVWNTSTMHNSEASCEDPNR